MKTLKEILDKSISFLTEKGVSGARRQAEELLGDVLSLKRLDLYLEFERPLTELELEKCRSYLLRRAKGEPLQYIRGFVEFLDCTIKVNGDVLIPRPETEIMADMAIQSLEKGNLKGRTLWDACCGSGCIGIALKKRFPELEVVLSDFSTEALAVAKENAKKNGVEVIFLQGNLLEPFQDKQADFFICNPPYVSEKEYQELESGVKDYEPCIALLARNEGLEFYQRLAEALPSHLNPMGKAWLEIGYNQGKAVQALFSGTQWKRTELKKDWSGRDRFFLLEME
ncbi:MAG: peptide chain release factor N(5)-glutamine methyltransferase [Waddliaceae bacterium]